MAKDPHAVALGTKGGKAKSPNKARTSEQCRKAANRRWELHYLLNPKPKTS